ncbi:MAG TPA: right-handed parallel beta-helix repeat-containing protein [Burkholderiaceae bacterium]
MKHWMTRLVMALAAALVSPAALAATYYLADCKLGAAPGCVAGSATNDGLSVARPKQLAAQLPRLQGGDNVLFAMGGAWTDASMGIYAPSASAANPVTWDSYSPAWGATAKPILTESRAHRYLFNLSDNGVKAADGGYVIRNLDLRGGGVGGGEGGIFLYFAVNDVLMENLDISGFNIGVYAAHNPKASNGWENYRITLRDSHLHHNVSFGWLGGAADLLIENNRLDHNGTRAMFDHDLYLSSVARGVVRSNTMTDSVPDAGGNCSSSVIVVHGGVDGLTIENNKIVQRQGSIPQCFGIEVSGGYADTLPSEYFHDVLIRSNIIVDVGYVGIGVRGCTRCVIEDNLLAWTGKGGSQAISMSVNTPGSNDELGTALTIRNNSIFMQDASGSPGVIRLLNEGTSHTVTSNLIVLGSATAASARCFDTSVYPFGAFAAFDNNLCFRQGGPVVYSAAYPTLAGARLAGFDVHGLNADPLLVALPSAANGYGMALRSGSSAAGMGNRTKSAPTDFYGRQRGAMPDVGAYQQSSNASDTVAPVAPTAVVLQ